MRSSSCSRLCRVEGWHLVEPNVGLLQKQDLVLSLLIPHQTLDIHFSGIPLKRTSKELPGIVALMLICQLLLPARWRQLWPLFMPSIWLWLGQVYWTDKPPVFSRISGLCEDPLGMPLTSSTYKLNGLVIWRRTREDTRALFKALKKALCLVSVHSKGFVHPGIEGFG